MKLVASFTLLSAVNAKWSVIEKDLQAVVTKLFPGNRNLVGSMSNINGYGCWCYFDDKIGNGKGNPVNLIDAECKILHGGYECVVADHAAQNSACEPWTHSYLSAQPTFLGAGGSMTIVEACDLINIANFNLGRCAADSCAVELRFTLAMANANALISSTLSTIAHSSGFNPTEKCTTYDGVHDPTKACCGTIPERFPFKTLPNSAGNPGRDCCSGAVYQTHVHKCCNPGTPSEARKGKNEVC